LNEKIPTLSCCEGDKAVLARGEKKEALHVGKERIWLTEESVTKRGCKLQRKNVNFRREGVKFWKGGGEPQPAWKEK